MATLVRSYGVARLGPIEDAVQEAMVAALSSWGRGGVPRNPAAWLQRVARNRLIDDLRKRRPATESEPPPEDAPEIEPALAGDIDSDLLRMLFVCCDDALPVQAQLVMALKVLCGFSVEEIARRLFVSEDNVYKRLQRSRAKLRTLGRTWDGLTLDTLRSRAGGVRRVIYLLFNEGYSSGRADDPIRRELCEEALYLGTVLATHAAGDDGESWALLSLMCFHTARLDARHDGSGGLLMLEEQDRSKWDRELMGRGFAHLMHAMCSDTFSRYHGEAAIAAEHCMASTYAETRWHEIIDLYEMLEKVDPSPLYVLNRAIAIAERDGPEAGLEVLRAMKPPGWLSGYYLWDGALGELERRAGHPDRARRHLERALHAAPTEAEKALLRRRLAACDAPPTG